ncbi:MAG: DUF4296 domain-containing protein [Saprospiraceae bacterium]
MLFITLSCIIDMKQGMLFLGFFLLLVGCKPKEPTLLIEEDKLVAVLKDAQLAESIIQQQSRLIQDSLVEVYYGIIYRTHNISKADLDSTLAVLRKEPKMLDRVYTKVLEVMTKEELGQ